MCSIVKRLVDLGWGPELEDMSFSEEYSLRRLPVVAEARPLTERGQLFLTQPREHTNGDDFLGT